jgi:hypothetical protein
LLTTVLPLHCHYRYTAVAALLLPHCHRSAATTATLPTLPPCCLLLPRCRRHAAAALPPSTKKFVAGQIKNSKRAAREKRTQPRPGDTSRNLTLYLELIKIY